jgi:hypothetical protein
MQAILIMLPIFIYAFIALVVLAYVVFAVVLPRWRGAKDKPASGTASRRG